MRVVYVSPMGGLGGAERCLLTAMAAVKRLGHGVRLISCTDGPLVERARELGAIAEVVPMPVALAATGESGGILRGPRVALAAWRYARRLRRAVDEARPDVVHSNGLKTHLLLAMARPGAPVVWHLHDFLAGRRVTARLLRWARGRAARAIAISRAVAADAGAVLDGLPIDTVMNAIDVGRFAPTGPVAELPGDGAAVRVGLVATYARWKGQDIFLRAAARVVGERPGLKVGFYIVGGAIYHTAGSQWAGEELDAMARELGIEQRVVRVPFVADTAGVYRALDVVVHASTKPEPFGLTIAEAMACGRAVVVSSAGGAAELFEDGVDAVGFRPGDEVELAGVIGRLVDDCGLREMLGRRARETAVARFSDGRLGDELVGVYRRAVGL